MTLTTSEFHIYKPETAHNFSSLEYLVLDSQALQHLEVVENAQGKIEGSLFHYVDNCKTPFGKRQLKRWLLSPLMNITKINQRLDAVEDLIENQYETDVFRSKIAKIPDLEKLLAKLYTYSVKHKVKAIYFENVSLIKLREFRIILRHFKGLSELVSSLSNKLKSFKSERLHQLLSLDRDGGLFPSQIVQEIAEFEKMIVWKRTQSGDEEIPEPQPGLDKAFDQRNADVDAIKARLEDILIKTRTKFKDQRRINWSHAKYRYELEIPQEYVEGKKKPEDYEFTSQRKDY